jgi:GDP-D-mannose dehydratase
VADCSTIQPYDYVLAIGDVRSVREFVEKAFACINRNVEWRGSGVDENGIDDMGRVDGDRAVSLVRVTAPASRLAARATVQTEPTPSDVMSAPPPPCSARVVLVFQSEHQSC